MNVIWKAKSSFLLLHQFCFMYYLLAFGSFLFMYYFCFYELWCTSKDVLHLKYRNMYEDLNFRLLRYIKQSAVSGDYYFGVGYFDVVNVE